MVFIIGIFDCVDWFAAGLLMLARASAAGPKKIGVNKAKDKRKTKIFFMDTSPFYQSNIRGRCYFDTLIL